MKPGLNSKLSKNSSFPKVEDAQFMDQNESKVSKKYEESATIKSQVFQNSSPQLVDQTDSLLATKILIPKIFISLKVTKLFELIGYLDFYEKKNNKSHKKYAMKMIKNRLKDLEVTLRFRGFFMKLFKQNIKRNFENLKFFKKEKNRIISLVSETISKEYRSLVKNTFRFFALKLKKNSKLISKHYFMFEIETNKQVFILTSADFQSLVVDNKELMYDDFLTKFNTEDRFMNNRIRFGKIGDKKMEEKPKSKKTEEIILKKVILKMG